MNCQINFVREDSTENEECLTNENDDDFLSDSETNLCDLDDVCLICSDGGELVQCDECYGWFHSDCVNLQEIPVGDWYCVFCSVSLPLIFLLE